MFLVILLRMHSNGDISTSGLKSATDILLKAEIHLPTLTADITSRPDGLTCVPSFFTSSSTAIKEYRMKDRIFIVMVALCNRADHYIFAL